MIQPVHKRILELKNYEILTCDRSKFEHDLIHFSL